MSSSLHHYGMLCAIYGVAFLISLPIFQLFGETLYWLKNGAWYNLSLFDFGFFDSTTAAFNTSFAGFNIVANFLFSIWFSVPIAALVIFAFYLSPVRERFRGSEEQPLTRESYLFLHAEVLGRMAEIEATCAEMEKRIIDFNSDQAQAFLRLEDMIVTKTENLNELKSLRDAASSMELTLSEMRGEIADLQSETLRRYHYPLVNMRNNEQ